MRVNPVVVVSERSTSNPFSFGALSKKVRLRCWYEPGVTARPDGALGPVDVIGVVAQAGGDESADLLPTTSTA